MASMNRPKIATHVINENVTIDTTGKFFEWPTNKPAVHIYRYIFVFICLDAATILLDNLTLFLF
jgi:hypothetical protein